jgi:hypothetical protein
MVAKARAERAARDTRAAPRRRRKPAAGETDILAEARAEGLLDGDKSEHISVRTTPRLLAAAKRRAGVTSNSELIELALATLAAPDPVAEFMKKNRGKLGKAHSLDY